MEKKSQRLGRQDWVLAGFRALVTGGVTALRVEPVARSIGATKGSFYWHFQGPEDWRDAMLDHWRQTALADVVAALAPIRGPAARLGALIRAASTLGRDPAHGGVLAEPALRAWASSDPVVAMTVSRVDHDRLAYLETLLTEGGAPPQKAQWAARLIYAAHIGQQGLGAAAEQDIADLDVLIGLLGLE